MVPSIRSIGLDLLGTLLAVAAATAAAVVTDDVTAGRQPLVPLAPALVTSAVTWKSLRLGLLAFGTFALSADTSSYWTDVDLLLFDELGLLGIVVAAIAGRHINLKRVRIGPLEVAITAVALAAIVSSVVANVPPVTWVPGLFLLLKGVGFFEIVRWVTLTATDVARMGGVVLTIAAGITVLGFVELLDPVRFQATLGLPVQAEARAGMQVASSIFLHPALFGWLTAYASLVCVAVFIARRSWWALPAAFVFGAGTLISGRRTPLIGLALAVVVGLAWISRRLGLRRAAMSAWAPAAVLVLVGSVALGPAVARLVGTTIDEYGASLHRAAEILDDDPQSEVVRGLHPRIALYVGSVAIARDEMPLGGGLGRFGSHLSRDNYSPLYDRYGLDAVALLTPDRPWAATDAFWPMILGETGVVGLSGMAAFFAILAVMLWRRTSVSEPGEQTIALAALFVLVEGMVRSATSSVFVAPPIAYFLFGTVGAALAAIRTPGESTAAD